VNAVVAFLIALVPSIGVLFIFWLGIRALLEADRRERAAQARIEAAERRQNPADGRRAPISARDAPAGADSTDPAS
jgi:threonine/homoserine/homoserine lactone efflux protein